MVLSRCALRQINADNDALGSLAAAAAKLAGYLAVLSQKYWPFGAVFRKGTRRQCQSPAVCRTGLRGTG